MRFIDLHHHQRASRSSFGVVVGVFDTSVRLILDVLVLLVRVLPGLLLVHISPLSPIRLGSWHGFLAPLLVCVCGFYLCYLLAYEIIIGFFTL